MIIWLLAAALAAAIAALTGPSRRTKVARGLAAFIFVLIVWGGFEVVSWARAWLAAFENRAAAALVQPAAPAPATAEALVQCLDGSIAPVSKGCAAPTATQAPTQTAVPAVVAIQCHDGSIRKNPAECPALATATAIPLPVTAIPTGMPTPVVVQAVTPAPGGFCQGTQDNLLDRSSVTVEGWAVAATGGRVYILPFGTYTFKPVSEGDLWFFPLTCSFEQVRDGNAIPHAGRTQRSYVEGTGPFTPVK